MSDDAKVAVVLGVLIAFLIMCALISISSHMRALDRDLQNIDYTLQTTTTQQP